MRFRERKVYILNKIPLKFVRKVLIDNSPAMSYSAIPCQAIIWTNADQVHRRIYAALGARDELSAIKMLPIKCW